MSVARRTWGRVRAALADMAYADRRRLEIQTGLVLTAETAARQRREEIARLDAAYHSESGETADRHPGSRRLLR